MAVSELERAAADPEDRALYARALAALEAIVVPEAIDCDQRMELDCAVGDVYDIIAPMQSIAMSRDVRSRIDEVSRRIERAHPWTSECWCDMDLE